MGDVITRALTCADCSQSIAKTGKAGPLPKRCPDCAKLRRLGRERELKTKRYRQQQVDTFICRECKQEFARPNMSGTRLYCEPCAVEHTRARRRELYRAQNPLVRRRARSPRSVPPLPTCAECGAKVERALGARPALRCKPCGQERNRQMRKVWKRRKSAERGPFVPTPKPERPCAGCRRPFVPHWKGLEARWCRECQAKRAKAQRVEWKRIHPDPHRAARNGADAEVINKFEIFERDRWKCGICKKRINKHLKAPHPMRASLDHVIPVSRGGGHVRANVRASHLRCNVARGNRGGNEQLLLVG